MNVAKEIQSHKQLWWLMLRSQHNRDSEPVTSPTYHSHNPFSKDNFTVILPSASNFPSDYVQNIFPTKILYAFPVTLISVACSVPYSPLSINILTIQDYLHKSQIFM